MISRSSRSERRPRHPRGRALAGLALALLAGAAAARPVPGAFYLAAPEGPAASGDQVAQRGQISLEQAIAMAQSRYPGRVARAETKMRGGRIEHEIRILGEGNRVRIVRIDAQTGRIL